MEILVFIKEWLHKKYRGTANLDVWNLTDVANVVNDYTKELQKENEELKSHIEWYQNYQAWNEGDPKAIKPEDFKIKQNENNS